MQPPLPVEVWERIIEFLWLQWKTLQSCALVCRTWYPRSRYLLLRLLFISKRQRVVDLAKLLRRSPYHGEALRQVIILGDRSARRPIPHLGTFAAMFARKLTRLEELAVANAEWQPAVMLPDVFLHLSAFTSIHRLSLYNVSFPSIPTFGRLICALPNLTHAGIFNLTFLANKFRAGSFCIGQKKIMHLELSGGGMNEIIDFFVGTLAGATLEEITLGFPIPVNIQEAQASTLQRLLEVAGKSLRVLDITFGFPGPKASTTAQAGKPEKGRAVQDVGSPRDSPLCITHNSCLETLSLRIKALEVAGYTWIYALLSQITSKKFRHVLILFDTRGNGPNQGPTLAVILNNLPHAMCASIDDFLSKPQFATLNRLELKLWVSATGEMPAAQDWGQEIFPRFPKLHARGILLAPVDVHHLMASVHESK